jgi:hypothetical protein
MPIPLSPSPPPASEGASPVPRIIDPGGCFKGIDQATARVTLRPDGSSIASLPGPALKWVVQPKLPVGKRCVHTHVARSDCKDTIKVILERRRETELKVTSRACTLVSAWNSPSILVSTAYSQNHMTVRKPEVFGFILSWVVRLRDSTTIVVRISESIPSI